MFSAEVFFLLSFAVLFGFQPGHGFEIIGGKEVKAHSLPYMALVRNGRYICGGTLIHPKWVLTAAHCENMTTVLLGLHSLRKKTQSIQQLKVTQAIPYPGYNKGKDINDMMLLRLEPAAKQTNEVKYLPLGSPGREPRTGSSCLVAGWGLTEKKKGSDVLLSANVTVVDRNTCSKYYSSKVKITKEMICAGSEKVDTCQGDSGGPILCKEALVGVTSFGRKSCKGPGVYAYITKKHFTWIQKIIRTSEMEE